MIKKLSFILVLWWLLLSACLGILLLGNAPRIPRPSLMENRMLSGFPELSAQSLLDGSFFSGIEDFIDVPLRNYSSGMIIRLAFSIASVVEPEILIVDEILAVGDEAFQKKSLARMMELMTGGTTVLFVSHDMASIRKMCSRVIWLDGGTIRMEGDPDEVCDAYRI